MTESSMQFAAVDDVRLAWQEFGPSFSASQAQTPLLLIMGYGGLMQMWPPELVNALAQTRRVIGFDNRGMGFSTASSAPFSIRLFAQDAASLVRALDIQRVHVLGWSMGAFVGLELALRYPTMVGGLILMSGSPGGRAALWPPDPVWQSLIDLSGSMQERVERMFANLFPAAWLHANPDPCAVFPPITAPIKDDILRRQAGTLKSWPGVWDGLTALHAPTLLLTGDEDGVVPPENTDVLASRIPNATTVVFPEAGHGFFYQQPKAVADAVNAFLCRTEAEHSE
jgi:pimeloyl-ACP methyl ester carboxylesterase